MDKLYRDKRRWVGGVWQAIIALGAGACMAGGGARVEVDGTLESFDEYVAGLPQDDTGAYIVEGDIRVTRRADLMDYYAAANLDNALILDRGITDVDNKYTASGALGLTYCVSSAFGANHARVRDTFAAAAQQWMDATKLAATDEPTVRLTYVPAEDASCNAGNPRVFFDVSPSSSPAFVARSFFPNDGRADRSVLITPAAFPVYHARTFQGVLRHEIGHVLGFRHEHINALGGECDESVDHPRWRPLTSYDVPSVMHYREPHGAHCFNSGLTDYTLTTHDHAGVRCLYTTQARSASNQAADACRALTALSSAAAGFGVDNDGRFYRWTRSTAAAQVTSTVSVYAPPTVSAAQHWRTLWSASEPAATATVGILVGGTGRLYRRTAAGLWRWTGTTWVALSGNAGTTAVVARVSGDLFRLNADGSLDRFLAGSSTATRILGTSAPGRALYAGSNDLFLVDANGSLRQWTQPSSALVGSWSGVMGTGIEAVAKTEAGRVFVLLRGSEGTVMVRGSTGVWTTLTTAASGGASALWGGLEVPYISAIDRPSTTIDESKTVLRNPVGTSWYKYALSSSRLMKGGNLRVAVHINDKPYAYETP
jgi:hypothetical protein